MKWSDSRSVEDAIKRRRDLVLDLQRIESGMAEATIHGRYQRSEMSAAHTAALDKLMRDHVRRRISEVDAELEKFGVTVDDDAQA